MISRLDFCGQSDSCDQSAGQDLIPEREDIPQQPGLWSIPCCSQLQLGIER
jgi:hypothetical protein